MQQSNVANIGLWGENAKFNVQKAISLAFLYILFAYMGEKQYFCSAFDTYTWENVASSVLRMSKIIQESTGFVLVRGK